MTVTALPTLVAGRRRAPAPGGRLRAVPLGAGRRPPPPAPSRRAADPLRVRDVLVAALGRRGVRAAGNRTVWLDDFASSTTTCGRLPDPDRPGVLHALERSGGIVALYPSPAGATESRASTRRWTALVAAQPRARPTSSPTPRRWSSTAWPSRHQHAIVPIDRATGSSGCVKSSWEGISGGSALEAAVAGSSTTCATRRGSPRERDAGAGRRRSAGAQLHRARRRPGAPRGHARRCASSCTVTEPPAATSTRSRCPPRCMIDPARRAYDDATRERLVELFGAPERWASTTHRSCSPQVRPWSRALPG